ncbi:protein FMC1 homolog [Misgurnus anguillicaudatus]|uniref:protein FMC1 homolog n=1 Tax=Misgurnus anguillicaudatus TaxID=75329 RepID=UPI002435243E|nr:protein FMC1 homolog [Misgurnus anguillicaudatus]
MMASLTSPLRVCRGILKEIRFVKGSGYRNTLVYKYVLDQFRRNQVTGAQYCRAHMDALHAASTYQCLLTSTRMHLHLHQVYHARGDRDQEQMANLVGLTLPTQPGGKGWET